MDPACGSGLTGTALKNLGYSDIQGMDISRKLLKIAETTGAYTQLHTVDMQKLPLPFEDDRFEAVNCIGAPACFETSEILKELCRITRAGGFIVFSRRDDMMAQRTTGRN
jgi:methyltransferase-like protein 27